MTILTKAALTNRNTTTVLADDPDLSGAALSAGKFYEIESHIIFWSAVTPAFKWAFKFTGSIIWCQAWLEFTDAPVSNGDWQSGSTVGHTVRVAWYKADFTTPRVGTSSGNANVNFRGPMKLSAYIKVGDTGGNFSFQWAQNVSNGTNTYVDARSYLYYTELLNAA